MSVDVSPVNYSDSDTDLHAKYEGSFWKGSKLMTNVKVVQQTNKQTNKHTDQKQCVLAIATGDIKRHLLTIGLC